MSVRTQGPELLISLSVCVQYFSIPLSLLFNVKRKATILFGESRYSLTLQKLL